MAKSTKPIPQHVRALENSQRAAMSSAVIAREKLAKAREAAGLPDRPAFLLAAEVDVLLAEHAARIKRMKDEQLENMLAVSNAIHRSYHMTPEEREQSEMRWRAVREYAEKGMDPKTHALLTSLALAGEPGLEEYAEAAIAAFQAVNQARRKNK
jgi:hypothetical protein